MGSQLDHGVLQAPLGAAAFLGAAGPYEPRPLRFLRRERIGDWRLKVYGIAASADAPRAELVDATVEVAADVLPRPAVGGGRYGVGFAIAHDAATLGIALVYWWQSVNELHQRIYTSPLGDVTTLTKLADPAAGCVWELRIVDFESRAWVEDVLANPGGPDLERYLTREYNAVV
jgi:hypothetical protein